MKLDVSILSVINNAPTGRNPSGYMIVALINEGRLIVFFLRNSAFSF